MHKIPFLFVAVVLALAAPAAGQSSPFLRGFTGYHDLFLIDAAGNVYSCGPGGIHVFAPDSRCLGVIRVPEYTANFCWGGDDFRSLFVTASTSLYRIRMKTPGAPQMV